MTSHNEKAGKELELARAVVAGTIMYGHVERDGGDWVIRALVTARSGAGVVLQDFGGKREEPGEARAGSFSGVLARAIELGMGDAEIVNERCESLLRAWTMQPF